MKTKNLNLAKMALFLFMGLSITLVSCSGEDGETGPAGKDGVDGQDGVDGKDGNANVVVSDWMEISWTGIGNGHAEMEIDIPDNEIANGGVALVYLRIGNEESSVSHPLPYSIDDDLMRFELDKNGDDYMIRMHMYTPLQEGITEIENNPDFSIRYVLVPATMAEASGIAETMPENFGEAAALLGLD